MKAKRLLTLLLAFLSFSVQAASPSYSNFSTNDFKITGTAPIQTVNWGYLFTNNANANTHAVTNLGEVFIPHAIPVRG